jgi:hypothetical protein
MVRAFILILALLEVALGAFALVATVLFVAAHPAGLSVLPLPVLAMTVLLLAASAALFVRRPWSYYAHIVIIVLLGVLFALSGGALLGMDAGTGGAAGRRSCHRTHGGVSGAASAPPFWTMNNSSQASRSSTACSSEGSGATNSRS